MEVSLERLNTDTIHTKPEHLIGISTGFSVKAFKAMYEGVCKYGQAPDVVACGSKAVAEDAYSAAQLLGYELAIVLDEEISPKRFYLMRGQDLANFPGGFRN